MTRAELLVACAAARPELTGREVEAAIDALFAELTAAIIRGDRVELRGFGVLRAAPSRRTRSGRVTRFRAGRALAAKIASS